MSEDNGTLALTVELDTTANPPVVISQRSPKGKPKIQWQRTGSKIFTFKKFKDADPAFSNVVITSNKITCDFSPPSKDPEGTDYPYTITVKYDKNDYTSDKIDKAQVPGRAVIRN